MATSIYLGNPPENIKKWIEEHVQTGPVFKDETQVTYVDGTTQEYLIEGELTQTSIPNAMDTIKEVTIGNKVTSIGTQAFYEANTMSTIHIPNNVTSIGDSAFWGCESLKEIIIPDSVTSIGMNAFYRCESLKEITILNDTTIIGSEAYMHCTSLTSLPNSTIIQVEQLFNSGVFGMGQNISFNGPAEYTITCKDGTVHAVGKWNEIDFYPEGWDITVTPL